MNNETRPQRNLGEVAVAYFKDRLLAISDDIHFFETKHREGRLAWSEFLDIHRSLMQAKREVEAALDRTEVVSDS
jgi:hypothetical protein